MSGRKLSRKELQRLYEEHGRGLLAYACSLLLEFSSAEDVLHQVFERLLRGGIEIEGPPTPYLYRAVRNASFNHVRNRRREVNLHDSWLESPVGMEWVGVELQSALKELPEEQREVIMLHVWGQMSFEDVAEALNISPNTVASRYRYGISKLREQFKAVTKG